MRVAAARQHHMEQSAELQSSARQALEASRSARAKKRCDADPTACARRQADGGERRARAGQRLKRLEQQAPAPSPSAAKPNGGARLLVRTAFRLLSLGKAAEVLAISPGGAELSRCAAACCA